MANLNHLLKKFKILTENHASYLYVLPIAAIYIIVAINSVGFHHYDEHFQIVEFANYKMGWINSDKLTWEFREKIRPGFQPFICYIIFNICKVFGDIDGYDLTLVLRLVTAALSLVVLSAFINSYKHDISEKLQPYFFLLSYFLWFLPYINVRFSSETWSGIFLLLTLTVLKVDKNKGAVRRYWLIGFLVGISTLLRYQSALFVFGIGFWFILIEKTKLKDLIKFGSAILLVLAVGVLIDCWLYSSFTISFYNYFNTNIVKNVASKYGILPWYWITLYLIKSPGPFGILILASFLIMWRFEPKNRILWVATPFLIVHSIIPHKELRFLFPLANLCPLFMTLAYQHLKGRFRIQLGNFNLILFAFLITCNVAGLIAVSFTGASGQVATSNYIHRNYKDKRISVILNDVNPYIQGPPLYNTFYDGRGIDRHTIISFWNEDLFKFKKRDSTVLLIIREDDFTGPKTAELFQKYGLVKVYQNIPDLVEIIYNLYDKSLNGASIWVYQFK